MKDVKFEIFLVILIIIMGIAWGTVVSKIVPEDTCLSCCFIETAIRK